ncbi:ATP-binding protein [Streptomyces sp. NPDC057555]|uniref:ATP-binding protein n=1 Tax=Streptomyces sp. NPDC057555 TaxID=3346166 RepID=UPI00367559E4
MKRTATVARKGKSATGTQPVVSRWTRHRRCVALARAELRAVLKRWGLGAIEDTALLVLSELLTNAVRHAHVSPGREIETRYLREANGLRIEVHDASDELPVLGPSAETGGWGLLLVDQLATRWGVAERDFVGKLVWAVVTTCGGSEA